MVIDIDEEIKKVRDLINQKAINEAREKLNSILSLDKKNGEAYYLYGYIEVLSNNYPLAASLFKMSLENTPSNANAAYYIGVCEEKQGLQASAMVFYRKALELNPNHAMAREKVPAGSNHNRVPEFNNNNNTPPNGQGAPANHKTITPHQFRSKSYRAFIGPVSEFYERLTLDKSFEAQSAAQIIKEIEVEIIPRSIDYWRSFIPLVILLGLPSFLMGCWHGATHTPIDDDEGLEFIGYLSIILFVVAVIFRRLVIKQIHYYFSNGNLTIKKGLFSVKSTKWELYRVENIEWNTDILGRSSLILKMMHTSLPIKLRGIGKREDAEFMCNRLNELVRILRMYSSLKGVIN